MNYNLVISYSMKATELHKLRKVLGMTQAGLAKAVGVTSNAIALAERGERGIGEPLARLIRMLVQIHRGVLVPRRKTKRRTR
jgi:transcriptional regulator with XRE-family HTH domain